MLPVGVGWMVLMGWDGMGLIIIGRRYSKSTFGANNAINVSFIIVCGVLKRGYQQCAHSNSYFPCVRLYGFPNPFVNKDSFISDLHSYFDDMVKIETSLP